MGRLISALDRSLNRVDMSTRGRQTAGAIALIVTIGTVAVIAHILEVTLYELPFGTAVVAIAASTLLAQRSLYEHVERVAVALETKGLAAARQTVSHIVGRDPDSLDEAGVARAAIESLAENFSDGVVAPAFWLAAAGLPAGAAYKAINTADSMVGHRTPRHGAFGWAAARIDDLVNVPASRLSALLIVAAAAITPGASPGNAWRAIVRDARRHRSPNAGYPEAAMAGALDLALAGPRSYGGIEIADAVMGNGRRGATAADIHAALSLYFRADAILVAAVAALTLVVTLIG
jgi:adenosylcobinamide-phosphate synthase